jgi:hypothetical protein
MNLFFQFHSHSTFQFVRFVSHYFNKLEKKILISYFPTYFPWYNQTLENIFQLIFHDTTNQTSENNLLFRNLLFKEITFQNKKLLSSKQIGVKTCFTMMIAECDHDVHFIRNQKKIHKNPPLVIILLAQL